MSVLGAPGTASPSGGRRTPLLVALTVAALLVGTAIWWFGRTPEQPAVEAERPGVPAVEPTDPAETPAAPPAAVKRPERREPPGPSPASPAAPAPAPAAGAVLRVTSDVDGAFVFVDRRFVGETPLETREVTPGSHQVNVSAEGYDGVSRTVEVAGSGPTEIRVELKAVRLDESVAVVHKHRFGSCEGRLTAGLDGLRYQTSHAEDAFHLPFAALETFEVDYLEKNLRVAQRGGRTWNFTTTAENADPLFVFHREVEEARAKLAASR